jgi:hypothetical protein
VLSAVDSLNATEAEKARIDLGHIILPCRLDTTDSVHPPAWEIKPGSVVIVRITADLGSNGIVARHRPRPDEASFQQGIVSWLIGEKLPSQEIILRVAYERFKDGEFEVHDGSISFGRQI